MNSLFYLMSIREFYLLFQKIIDELLRDIDIMLILTGSSLSMMENDILGYRSPLYGRRFNTWKLQPFSFQEVYTLLDDISLSMEVYFIFGGTPYYLSFYDKEKNLIDNIKHIVLTKGLNLYDELLILLRQEFRGSRTYRLLLKYISLGYKSLGKLCSATGMDKSNISRYLDTLKETDIIEHILPFGKAVVYMR